MSAEDKFNVTKNAGRFRVHWHKGRNDLQWEGQLLAAWGTPTGYLGQVAATGECGKAWDGAFYQA